MPEVGEACDRGGLSLTGDADVGLAALGGPSRAPGDTLAPEVLRPKQLLHLLPGDLDAGLSHHQTWGLTHRQSRGGVETDPQQVTLMQSAELRATAGVRIEQTAGGPGSCRR